MSNERSDSGEHLSEHGYYHELLEDEAFILELLNDPMAAVASRGLQWDERNNERVAIARKRILAFAKDALLEVRVLNFRNCSA